MAFRLRPAAALVMIPLALQGCLQARCTGNADCGSGEVCTDEVCVSEAVNEAATSSSLPPPSSLSSGASSSGAPPSSAGSGGSSSGLTSLSSSLGAGSSLSVRSSSLQASSTGTSAASSGPSSSPASSTHASSGASGQSLPGSGSSGASSGMSGGASSLSSSGVHSSSAAASSGCATTTTGAAFSITTATGEGLEGTARVLRFSRSGTVASRAALTVQWDLGGGAVTPPEVSVTASNTGQPVGCADLSDCAVFFGPDDTDVTITVNDHEAHAPAAVTLTAVLKDNLGCVVATAPPLVFRQRDDERCAFFTRPVPGHLSLESSPVPPDNLCAAEIPPRLAAAFSSGTGRVMRAVLGSTVNRPVDATWPLKAGVTYVSAAGEVCARQSGTVFMTVNAAGTPATLGPALFINEPFWTGLDTASSAQNGTFSVSIHTCSDWSGNSANLEGAVGAAQQLPPQQVFSSASARCNEAYAVLCVEDQR